MVNVMRQTCSYVVTNPPSVSDISSQRLASAFLHLSRRSEATIK